MASSSGYSHLVKLDQTNHEYGDEQDGNLTQMTSSVSFQSTARLLPPTPTSVGQHNPSYNWVPRKVKQWKEDVFKNIGKTLPMASEIYYSVFRANVDTFRMPLSGFADAGPTSGDQFEAVVDSVIVAIEKGILPKRIAQGSSGSYFMYDSSGAIVGVFKPKDEEPYGSLSPKWTKWIHRNLFPCFFGRSCLIPNNGYICEAAASVLDRQLQTYIVPRTDVVYLSSTSFYYRFWDRRRHFVKERPLPKKVGSFQLFLHGYEQANVFLRNHPLPGSNGGSYHSEYYRDDPRTFEWTHQVVQQFREELEKLVILDYIMRNTDRGLDNWMIKLEWIQHSDGSKTPHLKIGAIDSGLSFPWKHPDEWRSYPFGWLFLPLDIIGQPFSRKTREHFLPMLTSSTWWEDSAIAIKHMFGQDSEFKERMWKRQWAVMKGQAFNVVESLKNHDEGPLELARRTRVLVWDDVMDVPVSAQTEINNAMDTPLWNVSPRANVAGTTNSPVATRSTDSIANGPEINNSVTTAEIDEEQEEIPFPGLTDTSPSPLTIPQPQLITTSPSAAPTNNSPANSMFSIRRNRPRGSSLTLEARYRSLSKANSKDHSLWNDLIQEDGEQNSQSSTNQPNHYRPELAPALGFTVAEEAGSKRVIVERLQTVTSRQPLLTWC